MSTEEMSLEDWKNRSKHYFKLWKFAEEQVERLESLEYRDTLQHMYSTSRADA